MAEIIGQAQPSGPVVTSFTSVARIKAGDTDCSGCKLSGASFRNTDLSHVNLSAAILQNADLTGAKLRDANISGADLSTAKGLTQAQLAHEIGVTRTTVARWEMGLVSVSEPMAKLIRIIAAKHKPKKRG